LKILRHEKLSFPASLENSNIEIPAFAEAASRRQAKQILNSNFQNSRTFFVKVICILDICACFGFRASNFEF